MNTGTTSGVGSRVVSARSMSRTALSIAYQLTLAKDMLQVVLRLALDEPLDRRRVRQDRPRRKPRVVHPLAEHRPSTCPQLRRQHLGARGDNLVGPRAVLLVLAVGHPRADPHGVGLLDLHRE